ncbi:MAG: hypothetical protein ABI850_12110, partial [Flavobacterium sp.]
MRIKFLLIALLVSVIGFSQSVNDYKAVIIPLKYEFIKTDNQYRLATSTKSNLVKAGFQAFYINEEIPAEFSDRCQLLYVDVKKENGFLVTKLFVELKDCYGKVIFTSQIGKSKEKDYETAYREALNEAFISVNALHYKYSGKTVATSTAPTRVSNAAMSIPAVATTTVAAPVADISDPNLL